MCMKTNFKTAVAENSTVNTFLVNQNYLYLEHIQFSEIKTHFSWNNLLQAALSLFSLPRFPAFQSKLRFSQEGRTREDCANLNEFAHTFLFCGNATDVEDMQPCRTKWVCMKICKPEATLGGLAMAQQTSPKHSQASSKTFKFNFLFPHPPLLFLSYYYFQCCPVFISTPQRSYLWPWWDVLVMMYGWHKYSIFRHIIW